MRLLKALNNEPVDRIPFWYMRQAGRYLPEYNRIRKGKSFLEMAMDPQIATEISIQPYKRFLMDGIIMFADILTPIYGVGVPVEFKEKIGPVLKFNIFSERDRELLNNFNPEKQLTYIQKILINIKNFIQKEKQTRGNEVALIGFAGAPFTIISYLIEQGTSKRFEKTKEFLFYYDKIFHEIMETLTELTIHYLKFQIQTGVDIVQIFDSWGGILSQDHYYEFCFPYMQNIIQEIKKMAPIIIFVGNNVHLIPLLVQLEPNCISLDWRVTEENQIPEHIGIQGNLDPLILYGSRERVKKEVLKVLDRFSGRNNFIFNLGHGIHPGTPLHNVQVMVDTIRNYSRR